MRAFRVVLLMYCWYRRLVAFRCLERGVPTIVLIDRAMLWSMPTRMKPRERGMSHVQQALAQLQLDACEAETLRALGVLAGQMKSTIDDSASCRYVEKVTAAPSFTPPPLHIDLVPPLTCHDPLSPRNTPLTHSCLLGCAAVIRPRKPTMEKRPTVGRFLFHFPNAMFSFSQILDGGFVFLF